MTGLRSVLGGSMALFGKRNICGEDRKNIPLHCVILEGLISKKHIEMTKKYASKVFIMVCIFRTPYDDKDNFILQIC